MRIWYESGHTQKEEEVTNYHLRRRHPQHQIWHYRALFSLLLPSPIFNNNNEKRWDEESSSCFGNRIIRREGEDKAKDEMRRGIPKAILPSIIMTPLFLSLEQEAAASNLSIFGSTTRLIVSLYYYWAMLENWFFGWEFAFGQTRMPSSSLFLFPPSSSLHFSPKSLMKK